MDFIHVVLSHACEVWASFLVNGLLPAGRTDARNTPFLWKLRTTLLQWVSSNIRTLSQMLAQWSHAEEVSVGFVSTYCIELSCGWDSPLTRQQGIGYLAVGWLQPGSSLSAGTTWQMTGSTFPKMVCYSCSQAFYRPSSSSLSLLGNLSRQLISLPQSVWYMFRLHTCPGVETVTLPNPANVVKFQDPVQVS